MWLGRRRRWHFIIPMTAMSGDLRLLYVGEGELSEIWIFGAIADGDEMCSGLFGDELQYRNHR